MYFLYIMYDKFPPDLQAASVFCNSPAVHDGEETKSADGMTLPLVVQIWGRPLNIVWTRACVTLCPEETATEFPPWRAQPFLDRTFPKLAPLTDSGAAPMLSGAQDPEVWKLGCFCGVSRAPHGVAGPPAHSPERESLGSSTGSGRARVGFSREWLWIFATKSRLLCCQTGSSRAAPS